MNVRFCKATLAVSLLSLSVGCAAPARYDYTAYRANRPASIVVLPPLNKSMEVAASYGVLSRATAPLAEAGYYVLPVALVDETLKQNGLAMPDDMHNAPPTKLREVFGADAALYMEVTKYGATYAILASDVTVTANAKMIDLRSGDVLWAGSASASTAEQQSQSGGGLVGLLIVAVINQIINTVADDRSTQMAAITNQRLLGAGQLNGPLYGPRSPKYQSD
ncbi:DUF799 domain-containing protein [Pigmentiphaga litoralis]|uniref:Lipoprotein n=1 Tax=Pigmentiphaga litoralis TaxID=516702 RepID=A0A7Y9IW51_9BURK|nr:DUF799 domain-containing protein [Pigmentiphaga litoralis]NYE22208.1 hypothetical protein [Pigmentiphaga litoralis]NYE84177.1 hypothetical protein [Pigmentiphaga litoralis]